MAKFPLSRRGVSNWHNFLHKPEEDFDVKMGRSERVTGIVGVHLDDVDMPISDSNHAAAMDKVDIAFGKGKDKKYIDIGIEYSFNYLYLALGIGSVLFFIFDIFSDIYLAKQYFDEDQTIFGIVTIVLVAGPSFVMCCLGIHWYWIDYKLEQKGIKQQQEGKDKHWNPVHVTPTALWILRIVCTLLQIGPLLRTVEYLYYGWMSMKPKQQMSTIERIKYHNWMLYEDLDACLLRLFEAFLESAPQLVFQLYAWSTVKPEQDVVSLSWRIIGLVSSWACLSITLVSYHKSLRYSLPEKRNITLLATPFYFIWRACEVGARVICISLFAMAFQAWILLPILIHWFIITIWIMLQKISFYEIYSHDKIMQQKLSIYRNVCFDKSFNIICGYVMIFCFLNLQEGNTRFRYIVFYIILYVENFVMIFVCMRYMPTGAWYVFHAIILFTILSFLHIIFQLIYYKFFHPQDIKYCLPCDRNVCFESVCHQLKRETKQSSFIEEQSVIVSKDILLSNNSQDYEMQKLKTEPLLAKNIQNNQNLPGANRQIEHGVDIDKITVDIDTNISI